ncbi:MAG TPA: hypothetical protein VMF61_11440 [Candidatus Acidoferrales bacterium]|nr:hypothetical protein [Candidatus Acidoferrales bacterium]
MAKVPPFHSVNEVHKPADERVYHNTDTCPAGQAIPDNERLKGEGGYRHCDGCMNRLLTA